MGTDLHDKCSCGRIKKSYVKKCHHCRLGVATEVKVFHNRPKTQSHSDTLSNCKGCGVQIGKKKKFCKTCQRSNRLPEERMNSNDHIDQRWLSTSNSSRRHGGNEMKCNRCGARMYGYRLIPIIGKKHYSCHNCCSICGGRNHGIYYDRSVYVQKNCTCPKIVSYCGACGRSDCSFQCDMDG